LHSSRFRSSTLWRFAASKHCRRCGNKKKIHERTQAVRMTPIEKQILSAAMNMRWRLIRIAFDRLFAGKPIIGLVGGIGSGKSFIAQLFADEGCMVIDSDAAVGEAYQRPEVREKLREWWGGQILLPNGQVNRKEIAQRIFNDEQERRRLEQLIHPIVGELR